MTGFLAERLRLTEDQKKQVEAIQKDVDEKLVKILTEDQQKQLKEMKNRSGRDGFGRVGDGPGEKDGGKGGNPPLDTE